MSEEEKVLQTIRFCANDYQKQEDGIQCFEWGDLWILNEYIEKIQQENKQLKEQVQDLQEKVILLKASESMLELEKYYGDRDKYKEVIEEVREEIEKSSLEVNTKEFGNLTVCNSDDLLQILYKVKEVK